MIPVAAAEPRTPVTRDGQATDSLLIISRSGRALAASAHHAGYVCDIIDEFGDADTHRLGRFVGCAPGGLCRDSLQPLLQEWQSVTGGDGAVILPASGFEAQPSLLTWLRAYGTVAANHAPVVSAVKDPARFFPLLDSLGIRHPRVLDQLSAPGERAMQGEWLAKRVGGEGGVGIRRWTSGEPIPAGTYLQQKEDGRPASAVFLADGSQARVVGYNLCFNVGELGGSADYRFAAIIRSDLPRLLADEAVAAIRAIVAATGLRGLCGMDMLVRETGVSVLEINPRPPASLELHEDRCSLVAAHLAACGGRLPELRQPAAGPAPGKRIVYAPEPLHVPEDMDWPDWSADRPPGGSLLAPGTPVCTVFARGATAGECRRRLQQRHDELLEYFKKNIQSTDLNKFAHIKEVTA